MPRVKLTAVFSLTTNVSNPDGRHRTGGWSESVYRTTGDIPTAIQLFNTGYCQTRAGLLPAGASIVGQTYHVAGGASSSGGTQYPGRAGTQADIPQMALSCRIGGVGVANIRKFDLRGIPDARVTEGEYNPSDAFTAALNAFKAQLGSWEFLGVDLSLPSSAIETVDAAGLVRFMAVTAIPTNTMVRVLRTVNASNRKVGGLFRFVSDGTGLGGTLQGWNLGACKGGRARQNGSASFGMDPATFEIKEVVTRKVGRPSNQYRGRASKRR